MIKIQIEIDCGEMTCGDCEWQNYYDGKYCGLIKADDYTNGIRSPECIAATVKPSTPVGTTVSTGGIKTPEGNN